MAGQAIVPLAACSPYNGAALIARPGSVQRPRRGLGSDIFREVLQRDADPILVRARWAGAAGMASWAAEVSPRRAMPQSRILQLLPRRLPGVPSVRYARRKVSYRSPRRVDLPVPRIETA